MGDGRFVGEKATLASQRAVRDAAKQFNLPTRQIAASIRSGPQLLDLAGVDVMTIPLAAAQEFVNMSVGHPAALPEAAKITDRTAEDYPVQLNDTLDVENAGFDTLWDVPDLLVEACDELDRCDPNS